MIVLPEWARVPDPIAFIKEPERVAALRVTHDAVLHYDIRTCLPCVSIQSRSGGYIHTIPGRTFEKAVDLAIWYADELP